MQLSNPTIELLSSLESLSRRTLTHREDVGILIQLSNLPDQATTLEELSFLAKFVSKTNGIMIRIGIHDKGYENLAREFTAALEQVKTLMGRLLSDAPEETKQAFSSKYLRLTPDALQRLLALCHDLSWYKNWLIDHPGTHSR